MEIVTKAVINLIRSNQFYGALLMQMCRSQDPEMKAPAGVGIRNGRIELRFNLTILSSFSVEQVMGVLEHECLHLVMRHLGRQRNRDALAVLGEEVYSLWNIAADIAETRSSSTSAGSDEAIVSPSTLTTAEASMSGLLTCRSLRQAIICSVRLPSVIIATPYLM